MQNHKKEPKKQSFLLVICMSQNNISESKA